MKVLKSIVTESFTIALWFSLLIAGWQTALAATSMPEQLASPITWIHFTIYTLGGFIVLALILLLPGIIFGLVTGVFYKFREQLTVRRFLLSAMIGTTIIITIAFIRPALVMPIFLSIGSGFAMWVLIAGLVLMAYLFGTAFSMGFLQLLESTGDRIRWSLLWGWWFTLVTVSPIAVSLLVLKGALPGPLVYGLIGLITLVLLLVLFRFTPRFYNWMNDGGPGRWWIATIALAVVFIVTIPLPGAGLKGVPVTQDSPSVVLITIDALRTDALDCYPEGSCLRLGTPNIQGIADEGTLFENAWSTAPWTLPSVASFLSGLPPSAHNAITLEQSNMPSGATTIAEVLGDSGYITAGFVVNNVLGPGTGIDQGFDVYVEEDYLLRGGRKLLFQRLLYRLVLTWPDVFTPNEYIYEDRDAVRRARNFINDHSGEKFFLWLHLLAPHAVYYPPPEYRQRITEEFGFTVPRSAIMQQAQLITGLEPVNPETYSWTRAMYAGEVAFSDDNVGEIIQELNLQGIYDDCLVIVSSDHGEEFYDHDRIGHSHTLSPELLHIPLIIRKPYTISPGIRIDNPVSLVSLPATILDLVNIKQEDLDGDVYFTGRSFAPLVRGEDLPDEPVFVEAPLRFDINIEGIRFGDFYYIGGDDAVLHPRLFDLSTDPLTRYNVFRDHPELVDDYSQLLRDYADLCNTYAEIIGTGEEGIAMDRFRSLGYLN